MTTNDIAKDVANAKRAFARELKNNQLGARDIRGIKGALKDCVYIVKQDKIALRSTCTLITRAAFNSWRTDIALAGST
jgi:hypothetical protein